ncbi:MAG: DUF1565 domain-containing protein [Calothrix sp. C42_A2020_038]|nr:DUF1565 domain-containing protein [Calothrix sp. C42_A2020_038]
MVRSSVLILGLSITITSTVLFSIFSGTAVAQTKNGQERTVQGEQTISQVNVLFVNPSVGDDKAGNGGERTPFKSISQALRAATPNSTIMLAPGTYSEQTGEVFPLILKPGVSLLGDAKTKGRGIVIQGGDDYLSRSFGKQNVAIVGANQSSIAGVTIMNPNPRGYGLLIESTNPTISDNTFADSTQDGISITGHATPVISKNYFYQNKANGLTVSGNARPEIKENIFQQTGFGINIAQNAEPLIINNQIQYNRTGIVVQASSRPKLRNNSIQNNREDGLVVIAQAVPDLGNTTEPGGNEFRNNARYDINASASKQLFSAVGNTIANNRIAGRVDISGNVASSTRTQDSVQPTVSGNEITFTAPSLPETTRPNNRLAPLPTKNVARNTSNNRHSSRQNQSTPVRGLIGNTSNTTNTVAGVVNSQLMPLQPANSLLNNLQAPQPRVSSPRNNIQNSSFPTPTSLTASQNAVSSDTSQINYVRINPQTIEFSAQEPQPLQPIQTIPPVSAANFLSGSVNQPLSAPNNIIQMPTPLQRAPMPYNPPSLITSTGTQIASISSGIRYRVLVPTSSERDEEIIRFLAPGAFRTNVRGQGVIQVGVFSNTFNAEQMLRVLNNNGLKGMIEPLN